MWRRQLFAKKKLGQLLADMEGDNRLRRVLGPVGLTSLGVGAIIGTGIFVLVGKVAHDTTGPSLILSFVVAGVTCVFAALCYAEFASMAPVAGSAYTYAYMTMGELLAWIIGWDLVIEYTVAAATVAHGWSHYFQDFLLAISKNEWQWPAMFSDSPYTYDTAKGEFVRTIATDSRKQPILDSAGNAVYCLFDLPAVIISAIMTGVLVVGIRESAFFNSLMVIIKLGVVLTVIVIGATYVNSDNWEPFAPYGYTGVSFFGKTVMGNVDAGGHPVGMLAGAAVIFFAYIGFDSISTHSEEAKNPRRDLPIGIIASLVICTLLYIAVAAVLTGMVPFDQINKDAPVSNAFEAVGLSWARTVVAFGAIVGITSVLLVMMLSQPRVLLAMARDGLLPASFFGAVHPRFRTPWKSTVLVGAVVATLGALLPLQILSELVSIGTLLAFVIVCGAVLIMRYTDPGAPRPFRVPLFPLTPLCGMALCLLLMFSLPAENWLRLGVWLGIGLVVYFTYGRHHSTAGKEMKEGAAKA